MVKAYKETSFLRVKVNNPPTHPAIIREQINTSGTPNIALLFL